MIVLLGREESMVYKNFEAEISWLFGWGRELESEKKRRRKKARKNRKQIFLRVLTNFLTNNRTSTWYKALMMLMMNEITTS